MLTKLLKIKLSRDLEYSRISLIRLRSTEDQNLTLISRKKKIKELLLLEDQDFKLKSKMMKERKQLIKKEPD